MASQDLNAEFQDAFNLAVSQHERIVSEAIKKIIETTVPDDVKILLFETQSNWSMIPIVAFAMDSESPDETYYDEPFSGFLIEGGGPELVPDGAIDQDHYEDNGLDTYDATHALLAKWFSSLWREHGGGKFPIPVYIGAHDRDAFIDLRTGTECSSANIWPE